MSLYVFACFSKSIKLKTQFPNAVFVPGKKQETEKTSKLFYLFCLQNRRPRNHTNLDLAKSFEVVSLTVILSFFSALSGDQNMLQTGD